VLPHEVEALVSISVSIALLCFGDYLSFGEGTLPILIPILHTRRFPYSPMGPRMFGMIVIDACSVFFINILSPYAELASHFFHVFLHIMIR